MHKVLIFSMIMFGSWLFSVSIASAQTIQQPAFVKAGTAQVLNNTSTTQPYVITSTNGDNRLLVATLFSGCSGADYNTITYGGIQMTYLATNVDPNGYRYKTFYLFNPPTATSTLKVTWPSCSSYAKSISYAFYKNVNPVAPVSGNFGYQTSITQLSRTLANSSPNAFWILTTISLQAIPALTSNLTQRTALTTGLRQMIHDSIPQSLLTPLSSAYINFNSAINTGGTYALFQPSFITTPQAVFLASASTTNALYSLGTQFYNYSSVWIYVLGLVFLLVLLWFIGRKLWRLYSVRSIK